MKTSTLKNDIGEKIEVKRGRVRGEDIILVRHAGKDADSIGEFNTVGMITKDPKAWDFLAKKGIYTNSEVGKEAMERIGFAGFLVIHGEQLLVGPDDGKLICEAIRQLD